MFGGDDGSPAALLDASSAGGCCCCCWRLRRTAGRLAFAAIGTHDARSALHVVPPGQQCSPSEQHTAFSSGQQVLAAFPVSQHVECASQADLEPAQTLGGAEPSNVSFPASQIDTTTNSASTTYRDVTTFIAIVTVGHRRMSADGLMSVV